MKITFILIFLSTIIGVAQDNTNSDMEISTPIYLPATSLKNIILEYNKKAECFENESREYHLMFYLDRQDAINILRISSGSSILLRHSYELGMEIDGSFLFDKSKVYISIYGNKKSSVLNKFLLKTDQINKIRLSDNLSNFCDIEFEIKNDELVFLNYEDTSKIRFKKN